MHNYFLLIHTCNVLDIVIINGPQDTTVCMGAMAPCNCGFNGTDPFSVFPNWRIVFRSDNSSIITNNTIIGYQISLGHINGLQWFPDLTSGVNNAPNSKLLVGPVNITHNQSSYQCSIHIHGKNPITSSIGIMTVVGKIIIIVNSLIKFSKCSCNRSSFCCYQCG